MPTYVLDGGRSVTVPRGTLQLSVTSTSGAVRVHVRGGDDDLEVIRPTPHLVVVPRVTGRLRVTVSPGGGVHTFPVGTLVSLSLAVDGAAGHDNDRVQLPPVDLSGVSSGDLLLVQQQGDVLQVSAPTSSVDTALPEIAGRARAAARGVLDVERVPDQHAVHVVVAVDASASVRAAASREDGLAVALDVLLGVARVVTAEQGVPRVALVGSRVVWIPAEDPATFAQQVVAALVDGPAEVGFRSAHPDLVGLLPDENVVTYVVTDGVPGDLEQLARADATEGEARHLVLLGASAGEVQHLPVHATLVDDTDGRLSQPAGRTVADPVVDVVRSLLAGCFAPGTTLESRVGR